MSHDPILTRPDVMSTSSGAPHARGRGKSEGILDEIRALISADDVRAAQRLADKAAAQHPNDADLVNAQRILNTGSSYTKPGTGRDTREEYEWLQDPPERYRGKWVALIGRQVVGVAETLKELLDSLPPHLEEKPLTVQIAP